jgi:hypothetical protein
MSVNGLTAVEKAAFRVFCEVQREADKLHISKKSPAMHKLFAENKPDGMSEEDWKKFRRSKKLTG